jgi:HNH endonuclease
MPKKESSVSAASRLEGKFTINIVTGCHEWTGSLSSQGGYPTIALRGTRKPEYAHRVAWAEANGPIPIKPCPDGSGRWEIHHLCFNRICVNAKHLKLVTKKQHGQLHSERRAAMKLANAA